MNVIRNIILGTLEMLSGFIAWFLLIGLLCAPVYFFSTLECEEKGQSFNRAEYSLISGCMVEYRGKMVPLEAVKFVEHKESP